MWYSSNFERFCVIRRFSRITNLLNIFNFNKIDFFKMLNYEKSSTQIMQIAPIKRQRKILIISELKIPESINLDRYF